MYFVIGNFVSDIGDERVALMRLLEGQQNQTIVYSILKYVRLYLGMQNDKN